MKAETSKHRRRKKEKETYRIDTLYEINVIQTVCLSLRIFGSVSKCLGKESAESSFICIRVDVSNENEATNWERRIRLCGRRDRRGARSRGEGRRNVRLPCTNVRRGHGIGLHVLICYSLVQ